MSMSDSIPCLCQMVIEGLVERCPRHADMPIIHNLVQDDLMGRLKIGIETYKRPLKAFNDRDALRDAYEEALDLACYLRQAMYERDGK